MNKYSKKAYFVVANGTEVTEYLATKDVLLRAGINPIQIGNGFDYVQYRNDEYYDFKADDCDILIFPGGRGTEYTKFYATHDPLKSEVFKVLEKGGVVAAICAAPSILGELGLLKGKRYTCFPGFSKEEFDGEYTKEAVVTDGNIITARSMYYSCDFALAIIEKVLGKIKRYEVEKQIKGL